MPAFIIPIRSQMLLFMQVDLSTAAPEGSVAHLINEMVDLLDTRAIEEQNPMGFDLLAVNSIKVRVNANYRQSKTDILCIASVWKSASTFMGSKLLQSPLRIPFSS